MALQTSGQISHTDIATEFGYGTADFSLNADGVPILNSLGESRTVGVSQVAETDFYGLEASNAVDGQYDGLWTSSMGTSNFTANEQFSLNGTSTRPTATWHSSGDAPYTGQNAQVNYSSLSGRGATARFRKVSPPLLTAVGSSIRMSNWDAGAFPSPSSTSSSGRSYLQLMVPIQKLKKKTYTWGHTFAMPNVQTGGRFLRVFTRLVSFSNYNGGSPTGQVQNVLLSDSGQQFSNTTINKGGSVTVTAEFCFLHITWETNCFNGFTGSDLGVDNINFRP